MLDTRHQWLEASHSFESEQVAQDSALGGLDRWWSREELGVLHCRELRRRAELFENYGSEMVDGELVFHGWPLFR